LFCFQVVRRYHIHDREEYKKYNRLCGMITKLTSLLQRLDPTDDYRIKVSDDLLDRCAALRRST
jgi:U3 small nucleolar ribonucleoprotein protein IMP3